MSGKGGFQIRGESEGKDDSLGLPLFAPFPDPHELLFLFGPPFCHGGEPLAGGGEFLLHEAGFHYVAFRPQSVPSGSMRLSAK